MRLSGGLGRARACSLILGWTPWGCPKVQPQQHHSSQNWRMGPMLGLPPPTHPTQAQDSPLVLPGAGGTGHPLPCPGMPEDGTPGNSWARGTAEHLGWCWGSGWSQLSQRGPEPLHHLRVCTSPCAAQNPHRAQPWGGGTSEVYQHLCWGSGEGQLRAGPLWVGCGGSLRRGEGFHRGLG